jgi:UDP-N-acetyl-D-mannosaminuronate dehydrogenase
MNTSLLDKIKDKTVNIGIIGLGYVGFLLLELFQNEKMFVSGFCLDKEEI